MIEKSVRISERDTLSEAGHADTKARSVGEQKIVSALTELRYRWTMNKSSFMTNIIAPKKAGIKFVSISREGAPLLSAYLAHTPLTRLKGLFAFPQFENFEALVLQPCSAVHTFGFNYSIEIVCLDKKGIVIECVMMKPNCVHLCWRAHSVVEMAYGTAQKLRLLPGQQLSIDINGASYE